MIFGQPTTIPALIDALKRQVAADTGIASVFASLADDSDLLQAPAWGDKFIAIRPGKFPVDQNTAASGGRNLTGFNSNWRIAIFSRLNTDQEFTSERLLIDKDGPLRAVWNMLKGSLSDDQQGGQMFTPLDADGNCLLREPGRLIGFDLDAKKMIGAKDTRWWVIPTYWEFKFTADLT